MYRNAIFMASNQRRLKYTECKPLGLLYLGVIHTTVQALTQVKAWIDKMTMVCTAAANVAGSFSQLEYS